MSGLVDGLLGLGSPWGYVLVGLLAGLEAAALLGLVIPGEAAMLLGGVLAFGGRADLRVMMGCAAAGAILGDSAGYELGRRFSAPLRVSRLGRRVGPERWDRAERYVRRRGGRAVFLGRFVGVLRAMVPFVAGASRMPYRSFLPYNVLGAVLWAPGFVYLGFLAGHSYKRVEQVAGQASLLLAVVVVALGALALTARWVSRHPDRALAPVHRLAAHPAVLRVRDRYSRQLAFLAGRLSPVGALGLVLTLQLAMLALLGAAFGVVTEDVLENDKIIRVDGPVGTFLVGHREAWLTTVMRLVTELGGVHVVVPLLLTVGLLARWRSSTWRPLVLLVLAAAGAVQASTSIKLIIARPRPDAEALVAALGYGFPSGHSTQAAAVYLAVAVVLGTATRRTGLRVAIGAAALAVVALVGLSRVYLGVHRPTDVLGGWALGALWTCAVLTAMRLIERRGASVGTAVRSGAGHDNR